MKHGLHVENDISARSSTHAPITRRPGRHTATAIPFIYSFSGNCAASAPISTLMCLWAIYIFPGSVYIFPPAEQADPSWEYIIRLQTHECGNWDWGPDIPFLGIFVSNFRHFVFAVQTNTFRYSMSEVVSVENILCTRVHSYRRLITPRGQKHPWSIAGFQTTRFFDRGVFWFFQGQPIPRNVYHVVVTSLSKNYRNATARCNLRYSREKKFYNGQKIF